MRAFKPVIQKATHSPLTLLILVLGGAVALRLLFFQGVTGGGDLSYSVYAYRISLGDFPLQGDLESLTRETHGAAIIQGRLGHLLPIALMYKLFGVSEFTSIATSFAVSLGNVILAYLLGKLLVGNRVGLLAASFMAVIPVSIRFSTNLRGDDFPMAFFEGLAIYLLLVAARQFSFKRRLVLGIVSGLAIGGAYLIKETALLIIPVIFAIPLIAPADGVRSRPSVAIALLVFSIVFLLEGLFYLVLTGDPAFRLRGIYNGAQFSNTYELGNPAPQNFLVLLLSIPASYLLGFEHFALYPWILILSVVFFLIRREPSTNFLLIWLGLLFFLFNFASSSLERYAPQSFEPHRIAALLLPATILIATFTLKIAGLRIAPSSKRQKYLLPFLGFLLLLSGVLLIWQQNTYSASLDNLKEALLQANIKFSPPADPFGRLAPKLPLGLGISGITLLMLPLIRIVLTPKRHTLVIMGITTFLVASSIFYVMRHYQIGSYYERRALEYLKTQPSTSVVTDWRTRAVLEYLESFQPKRPYETFEETTWSSLRNAYVVINQVRLTLIKEQGGSVPLQIEKPTSNWQLVYEAYPSLRIYQVGP